jgi:hypothetical protein
MCQQKNSDEASPREEVACLDCPLTKIQPEMCSQGLIELSTITNGWTSQVSAYVTGVSPIRLARTCSAGQCLGCRGGRLTDEEASVAPSLIWVFRQSVHQS